MTETDERPDVPEVVAEHRETIELVAAGDDDVAALARNILATAEDGDE